MYFRPFRRRPRCTYAVVKECKQSSERPRFRAIVAVLIISFVLVMMISSLLVLSSIASTIAVSDAKDMVVSSINTAVLQIMSEGGYPSNSFVSFEKSDDGTVTLISSDMAQINALSAELLNRLVQPSADQKIIINIPAGNLTGISFLMGKGVDIPVEVVVLTSSKVEFNNNIVSAGINQTKHQINLEVIVDLDIIIPWGIKSAEVVTEVLISDTIIAGRVPETYLNMN